MQTNAKQLEKIAIALPKSLSRPMLGVLGGGVLGGAYGATTPSQTGGPNYANIAKGALVGAGLGFGAGHGVQYLKNKAIPAAGAAATKATETAATATKATKATSMATTTTPMIPGGANLSKAPITERMSNALGRLKNKLRATPKATVQAQPTVEGGAKLLNPNKYTAGKNPKVEAMLKERGKKGPRTMYNVGPTGTMSAVQY